MSFDIFPSPT